MSEKIQLIKPSTRSFFSESKKLRRYGLTEWLHGYIYARWIYLYISLGTGEHFLCRYLKPFGVALVWLFQKAAGLRGGTCEESAFANSYHGKVVTLEIHKHNGRL